MGCSCTSTVPDQGYIYQCLDMKDQYEINSRLFTKYNRHNKITDLDCLNRLKFILRLYQNWIKIKTKDEEEVMDIYDVVNQALSKSYTMIDFLRDFRYIVSQNRDILLQYSGDQSLECDIESCYVERRLNRNKCKLEVSDNQRRQLFFIPNTEDNDDAKSVFIQNILDGLHELIYHTIHAELDEFMKNDESDDEAEEKENVLSLADNAVKAFNQYIANKISSSTRYRSNRSINSRYNDQHAVNSKFMTTTYNDNVSHLRFRANDPINTKTKSDDFDDISPYNSYSLCFIDHILKEIETTNKVNADVISKFKKYLAEESYDSDAIEFDIEDVKKYEELSSNILTICGYDNVLSQILIKFCDKRASKGTIYDSGYRFFYWPYYEDFEDEYNLLWQTTGYRCLESNQGYSINHWYIPQKYKDLKYELLNNQIYQFTSNQFADTFSNATIKLQSWLDDPECRTLASRGEQWEKCYGIKDGSEISVQHIMSVLFYTDFTDQSAAFSGTFRRTSPFEADESLKARNREFWNWSKLLRETVECFGQSMGELYRAGLKTLYHGVSKSLIFDSTFIKLCGPLSTTAGLLKLFSIIAPNPLLKITQITKIQHLP